MPTIPDWSMDEHIEFELNLLRKDLPALDAASIRCFELPRLELSKDPNGVTRARLSASALGDLGALKTLMARLCEEGRGWIHYTGMGALPTGGYLIEVDYSDRTGLPATFIVPGGHNASYPDGAVIERTHIVLI